MKRRGPIAKVRSEGTKPERVVRRVLLEMGLHFRTNFKGVPGTPDIAFPRVKKAILVHGCFWHVHPGCAGQNLRGVHGRNAAFWQEKLVRNVLRDRKQLAALAALGWRVLVVWECECSDQVALRGRITRFLRTGERAEPDSP